MDRPWDGAVGLPALLLQAGSSYIAQPHLAVKVGQPARKLIAGCVTQRHSILQQEQRTQTQPQTHNAVHLLADMVYTLASHKAYGIVQASVFTRFLPGAETPNRCCCNAVLQCCTLLNAANPASVDRALKQPTVPCTGAAPNSLSVSEEPR